MEGDETIAICVIGSKVLVREIVMDEETKMGGFLLADTVKEKIPPQQGVVLAVGGDVRDIVPGQVVAWGLGAGDEIHIEQLRVVDRGVIFAASEA